MGGCLNDLPCEAVKVTLRCCTFVFKPIPFSPHARRGTWSFRSSARELARDSSFKVGDLGRWQGGMGWVHLGPSPSPTGPKLDPKKFCLPRTPTPNEAEPRGAWVSANRHPSLGSGKKPRSPPPDMMAISRDILEISATEYFKQAVQTRAKSRAIAPSLRYKGVGVWAMCVVRMPQGQSQTHNLQHKVHL